MLTDFVLLLSKLFLHTREPKAPTDKKRFPSRHGKFLVPNLWITGVETASTLLCGRIGAYVLTAPRVPTEREHEWNAYSTQSPMPVRRSVSAGPRSISSWAKGKSAP